MSALNDAGSILLFHAEVDDHLTPAGPEDPTLYSTFLKSRPETFEVDAISRIVDLQKEFPTLRCHIVHLSAARALPIVRSAKAAGHKLTVETCFHYLCLASDHSPCVAELKKRDEGDIMGAWGGISTLGFGLSLLWTEGRKRNVPIGKIVQWMSEKTASHAGLGDRKGKIAVGYDADFVIWNPDVQYTVTKEALQFKNKLTPYEGLVLSGRVEQTILRGNLIYNGISDTFNDLAPSGVLL